jgi:hypothetical protein
MATMSASRLGKSTFLEILAWERKRGVAGRTMLVNLCGVKDEEFKGTIMMRFVNQEVKCSLNVRDDGQIGH